MGENTAMDMTQEQKQAINRGETVDLRVDDTECVIVRKDIFDRVRRVLEYDDSEWSREELLAVAKRTFEDADTAGPIE